MNLYELTTEITILAGQMDIWAEEHEGDVSEFPLLAEVEALEGQKEQKILDLACWYKNLDAEAEAIKAEEKKLAGRRRAVEARAEGLKGWLASLLGSGQKLSDGRSKLSWRRSGVVVVNCDPARLPAEFRKTTVEARRAELKIALLAGSVVEGVEIVEKNNLQIK